MPKIDIPSLSDILALKPAAADAVSLSVAITTATGLRGSLTTRISELQATIQGPALLVSDKAYVDAERDSAHLRIAVKRIDELLDDMRGELLTLEGQATVQALRQEAQEVAAAIAALVSWQEKEFTEIRRLLGAGFRLEDRAVSLHQRFLAAVQSEYLRPEVRDAGAVGVKVPPLPSPGPRSLFHGWS